MVLVMDDTLRLLLDECHRNPEDNTRLGVAADRAEECDLPNVAWILRLLANTDPRRRVPTGSRVYGFAREDSDYDWVLWVLRPIATYASLLIKHADPASSGSTGQPDYAPPGAALPFVYRLSGAYRFGPINLIRVDHRNQFDCWREGTNELVVARAVHGPRTRDQAIAVFRKCGKRYGLKG